MKFNKKHILIGSLMILSVVIIIAVIYGRKTETFKGGKNAKAGPKNAKTISTGAAGAESCSATDCGGKSGTQYRNYTCYAPDGTTQVDYTLCAPVASDVSQTCTTGQCSARYGPATYTSPPACSPSGYSFTQSKTSTDQCYATDSFGNETLQNDNTACSALTAPPSSQTYTSTGATPCTTTLSSTWYGNQFIHYSLPVTTVTNATPLGTASQLLDTRSTSNSTLSFNNPTGTTLTLPSGLLGNFVLFMFVTSPASGVAVKSLKITATLDSTVSVLNIFENNGTNIATNGITGASYSGASFYYAIAFKKTSATTVSVITFSVTNMFANNTINPDLFLVQLNNSATNSICPAIGNTNQAGFNPTTCLVGSLPMMARYYLAGATAAKPLGATITQLFDSIGSSTPKTGNGTCSVSSSQIIIPPLSSTTYFMLFIQWVGTGPPPSAGTMKYPPITFGGASTITNSTNYYGYMGGASPNYKSNIIGNTSTTDTGMGKMYMSTILKITSSNSSNTIDFSTSNTVFPAGTVNGDLLLIQLVSTNLA